MASLTVFADALTWPTARELIAALQALTCLGHLDALGFWLGNCHGALPCRDYTRERSCMNRAASAVEARKERGISQGIGGNSKI